jgi:parvulin-like peptidyl-prolyl isomerase
MRKILPALMLFMTVLACNRQPAESADELLARVNGDAIYAKDFKINYQQLKGEQDEISQKNPKLIEQLKTRALNEVIVMALLRQEAMKRKLRVPREAVEGRLANWKDGYPPGGFEEMLRKQNTTEDFLKKRIEDQILIENIIDSMFSHESLVSDEELKKHFSLHQKDFTQPEKVHALQIVVPTKEEAEKIRQEILAGKLSFESAARQYSQSPDATKGGDIGFYARNEKIAAFNEAFTLTVGSVSKPVQSPYGIHLLKVVEKMPQKKLGFEEAKGILVKTLKRQKEVTIYKEWVTKLLKDGEIYRNEAVFAAIN